MFSLSLGTPEKRDNTEAAKGTALRSLNLNTHVHTVCKKGIPKNKGRSKSIYRKLSAVSINGITEDNVENELHYTCSYSKGNYNN